MQPTALEVTPLTVEDWGLIDYASAFARQEQLLSLWQQGQGRDTLVLAEHPAVVTLGRRGSDADLRLPGKDFSAAGIELRHINRGGLATAHEPGQLVAYPIVALKRKDLHWFSTVFLQVVISVLADYGLQGVLKAGEPGVWVNGGKICSFGIAVKKWVSSHGIALNVNNDLHTFKMIIPCGRAQEKVTSVASELACAVELAELKQRFIQHFLTAFAYELKS